MGNLYPTDLNNQSIISLNLCFTAASGHQKVLKNIQSPTVISNLLYKNITMVIHRFTDLTVERKTYLQKSTQRANGKKSLGSKRLEEKTSSAERVPKGKAWAILALRSLNGHLIIFFICPVKTRQVNQLKGNHYDWVYNLGCTKKRLK